MEYPAPARHGCTGTRALRHDGCWRFVYGAVFALLLLSCGETGSGGASSCGYGRHWVNGYYRSDGTYVNGYCRDNPSSTHDLGSTSALSLRNLEGTYVRLLEHVLATGASSAISLPSSPSLPARLTLGGDGASCWWQADTTSGESQPEARDTFFVAACEWTGHYGFRSRTETPQGDWAQVEGVLSGPGELLVVMRSCLGVSVATYLKAPAPTRVPFFTESAPVR